MNILSAYEKLEKLVQRLPDSLQSPILREVRPLKTLFLQQRPPRLLLLGDRAASRSELVNRLFASQAAQPAEDHLQGGAWQLFSTGHGKLRLLDGRRPASVASLRRSLTEEPPDLCLFLHTDPRRAEDIDADLEQAGELLRLLEGLPEPAKPSVLGVEIGSLSGSPEAGWRSLDAALHGGRFAFPVRVHGLFATTGTESRRLASAIASELPDIAKLEMVRLAGLKEQQLELAQSVVKSISAICGAVGTQPIPLADFPILTSLQAAMVAGIMHISGRELSMNMAGEWIGALGANLGAALVLREGARAVLKFVPIWGDIVAGGIAAAGTYGIGRAAIAYFIEGVSLPGAQKLFRQRRKGPPPQLT